MLPTPPGPSSHREPGTPIPTSPTMEQPGEHNMAATAPGPSRTAPPLPTSVRLVLPQAQTHTHTGTFRNRPRCSSTDALRHPPPQRTTQTAPPTPAASPLSPTQNGGRFPTPYNTLTRLPPPPPQTTLLQPIGARCLLPRPMRAKPRLLPGGDGADWPPFESPQRRAARERGRPGPRPFVPGSAPSPGGIRGPARGSPGCAPQLPAPARELAQQKVGGDRASCRLGLERGKIINNNKKDRNPRAVRGSRERGFAEQRTKSKIQPRGDPPRRFQIGKWPVSE